MIRLILSIALPAALAAPLLGACTARDPARTALGPAPGARFASLDTVLDGPRIGPAAPMAELPAWAGRPLRVTERADAVGLTQAVTLSGSGNALTVTLPGAHAADQRPTEAGIRGELAQAFPDTPMQVVTRPSANAYGPYGLAIGRQGNARCLYAWQWLETLPAGAEAGLTAPLSLRIRLCRSDITLEAMAAAVSQIRLVPRRDTGTLASIPATRAPTPETSAPASRRRLRADARVRQAEAAAPAEPEPASETAGGRRYLGDPAAALGPREASLAQDGRHGPVAPGAIRSALAGLGGPAPVAAAIGGASDLPPEAYRGPTASLRAQP